MKGIVSEMSVTERLSWQADGEAKRQDDEQKGSEVLSSLASVASHPRKSMKAIRKC